MPGCPHEGHTHHPWPSAGPLVICPGERTCGYCKGKDGKINHGHATNLRKHVYEQHSDGGKADRAGVEVMMYRPWAKSITGTTNAHHISRDEAAGGEEDVSSQSSLSGEDEALEASSSSEVDLQEGIAEAKVLAKRGAETLRTQSSGRVQVGRAEAELRAMRGGSMDGPDDERAATESTTKSPAKLTLKGPRPAPIDTAAAQQLLRLPNSGLYLQRSF